MRRSLLIVIVMLSTVRLLAQEDLMTLLDSETEPAESDVTSTWKGMRLISGHTTRVLNSGTLDFVISHRFGRLNTGVDEFYGLDQSQIRLGFEYGLTRNLNIGLGRSSQQKMVDGYLKYKVLRQKKNGTPITLTALTSLAIKTGDGAFSNPDFDNKFSQRLYYSYQLLVARKMSTKLSLQLMPTLIHRNTVRFEDDKNDIVAMGVGGRYKITNRMSINAEYYPQLNKTDDFTNALSFGIDIETGGHVFQLHVTNALEMIEPTFVAETNGDFGKGDIHFGFNVSRSFQLKGKDKNNKKTRRSQP